MREVRAMPARDLRLNPVLRWLFPLARHCGRPFLFCSEQPLNFDVPSNKPIKENPMIRVPSLLFAALLLSSARGFRRRYA